ncbi:Zn-dependent hydrolase [Lichenihabitans psoromatis]|uniref:Zn-dependent hydrolase n=1 Tax=Lichenihabitans psoromatis TaxID=2528642 RepID=UPI0010359DE8|nr:Zn-dependent hydrolase [Lichenihabitans psoromatis]
MGLGAITDPGRPYTRRCFTDRFLDGRRWLAGRFAEAGLEVHLDAAANMIGRLEGNEHGLPVLAIGSHSDTVPSGGRFDGCLGILAGLEAVRTLRDRGIRLRHGIEIIDFLSEEPSDYGLSCIGSRAMSGCLESGMMAFANRGGESLQAAMRRMGADGSPHEAPPREDIAAFLELHIEQGRILETSSTDIGVVTGIVGILRLEIVFLGTADHAGTTPFDLRGDALVAAARTVMEVRRIGQRFASAEDGYFIATTGCFDVEPNAANVVPGRVRLIVEARAEARQHMDAFRDELDAATLEAAAAANVGREVYGQISRSEPVRLSPPLQRHLSKAANVLGLSSVAMASGAGHDAAFVARIAPSAMIFVPSRMGRSHSPDEWTEKDQCADGAAVLLQALLQIDCDNAFGDHASRSASANPERPAAMRGKGVDL